MEMYLVLPWFKILQSGFEIGMLYLDVHVGRIFVVLLLFPQINQLERLA